jgi:hypothetical protein
MAGMMPVRDLRATPMSRVESELRPAEVDKTGGVVGLLNWRNAVSVYQIWANQCADEPNAFFNQINGGTAQLQLVAPTNIAAKIEGPAIADQSAYLIDPRADRHHRCAVAPS